MSRKEFPRTVRTGACRVTIKRLPSTRELVVRGYVADKLVGEYFTDIGNKNDARATAAKMVRMLRANSFCKGRLN